MRTNNMKLETFTVRLAWGFASTVFLLLLVSLLLLLGGFAGSSFAQEVQPRMFSSPAEASNALFQAAQANDEPALEAILGAGKEVTSSSDEAKDKLEREQFITKYQEMHRLAGEADGSAVLYIGAENWPFPIPLVSKNGAWYFDSKAGMEEIKFREIGENEATAIQVCEEFAMARNEAAVKAASEDPITQFAENLFSAAAANAGNKGSDPFHGYYFRVVMSNSAAGASNSKSLTLVAYPAEYRGSGVMTFILAHGLVYEKDLGPGTTTIAPEIKARTGSNWRPAAS